MYRYSVQQRKKQGIVPSETELKFLGFGTMNGKDGKPFKTREGGVMRLENLIAEIQEEMYKKITDNRTVEEEEAKNTAKTVGMAAIKYGDLSNQASKDYVFDVNRFTSFEGNTGIVYSVHHRAYQIYPEQIPGRRKSGHRT